MTGSVSMVAVAQLVEPWIVIPVVVGSSPISHPIPPVQTAHLLMLQAFGAIVAP